MVARVTRSAASITDEFLKPFVRAANAILSRQAVVDGAMKRSAPGKKLAPALKLAADRIYKRDPRRYRNLIKFIKRSQKQGWSDEVICRCLDMASPYLDSAPCWFPYVTKLLPKAKAQICEAEAHNHKTEVAEICDEFLEFVKQRKAARSRAEDDRADGNGPTV